MNELAVTRKELEFKLLNPTEGNFLRTIEWNKDEIEAAIRGKMQEYEGIVYTEDTMKCAKEDRAALNKLTKAIEDRRKAVKGYVMEPYDKFEKEVKDILLLIQKPVKKIDDQIKEYEKRAKEEKKAKIITAYDENIGDLSAIVPFERLYDSRWLNASVSLTKAKEELVEKITTVKRDLETINDLDSKYRLNAKDVYIQTLDLSKSMAEMKRLADLEEKLEADRKRKEQEEADRIRREQEENELKARECERMESETVKIEANPPETNRTQDTDEETAADAANQQKRDEALSEQAAASEKRYKMKFQVIGTKEQLSGLTDYMRTHGIKYGGLNDEDFD